MSVTASRATARQAPGRGLGLLWHQIRYEQLSFWRNPQSAFFTFVFPLVISAVFGGLFGGIGKSEFYYGRSALHARRRCPERDAHGLPARRRPEYAKSTLLNPAFR